jgi:two-component system, chemotaxis family, sensor kinase CheA
VDDAVRQAFDEEAVPLAAAIEGHLLEIERRAAGLVGEWRALLGALHTLKGNCGMVGFDDAEALAHAMEKRARDVRGWPIEAQARAIEDLLAAADRMRTAIAPPAEAHDASPAVAAAPADLAAEVARLHGLAAAPEAVTWAEPPRAAAEPRGPDAPGPVQYVRIPAEQLDRLLDTTVDVAAWHERLGIALRAMGPRHRDHAGLPYLELAEGAARRIADLRTAVMSLRLVPIAVLLGRFDRLVRDLARATGKVAGLDVIGGDVAVDKHVIDQIGEPLLHIVRNAIDHGLESPRERALAGKPERGSLVIDARAHGGVLTLAIVDDGRGIDPARLVAAAARRGIDARGWPLDRTLDLVFAPEVSTADRVTTLSGRGIGLDQARLALERIGGSIQVTSAVGIGTEFRIRVPLVITVQRSLLVRCGAEIYGIPFTSVIEAFRLTAGWAAHGATAVSWRGRDLPASRLSDEIDAEAEPAAIHTSATCVVVDRVEAPVGVIVDDVIGHQDLTIRDLDPLFGRPRNVTGASLLADGRIVPVLDLQSGRRAGAAAAAGGEG